jgi:hypothetical protein
MANKYTTIEAQEICWKARDAYFTCLVDNEEDKSKCLDQKRVFDQSCLPSWVPHLSTHRLTFRLNTLKQEDNIKYE